MFIYNPDKVKEPPKTFTDLLDPKWKGRVGVGDINYMYVMMAAALAATGDLNKVDDDKTKRPRDEAERQRPPPLSLHGLDRRRASKSGEIDVGIMWAARVVMWQNAGIPVKASFPDRRLGPLHLRHGGAQERPQQIRRLQIPERHARARRPDCASPNAWATKATVNTTKLEGRIAEQLALPTTGFTMHPPNYEITGKLQGATSEWWKKNMQKA